MTTSNDDRLLYGVPEITREIFGSANESLQRRVRHWIREGYLKTHKIGAMHATTTRYTRQLKEPDEAA